MRGLRRSSIALCTIGLALGPPAASAYWGPVHAAMNKRITREGEPFSSAQGGTPVKKLEDYLANVLFINSGIERKLWGVTFRNEEPDHGKDRPDDEPNEEKIDVTVRFKLEGRGDEQNTAEWIARLVAGLLREEGLDVGERGVGVRASRSRTAHADLREEV